MILESENSETPTVPMNRRRGLKPLVYAVLAVFTTWLVIAYAILPVAWRRYEKRHPALDGAPRVAHTTTGIPGDPVNLGFVTSEEKIHRAMLAAGWFPQTRLRSK